jgi:hypothetical protein
LSAGNQERAEVDDLPIRGKGKLRYVWIGLAGVAGLALPCLLISSQIYISSIGDFMRVLYFLPLRPFRFVMWLPIMRRYGYLIFVVLPQLETVIVEILAYLVIRRFDRTVALVFGISALGASIVGIAVLWHLFLTFPGPPD